MPLFQFIGAAIGASLVMSVASLVWPLVTTQPRPEALTRVREIVLQTAAGQGMAQVLGVSDEQNAAPVNVQDAISSGANMVVDAVAKSAQHAVTARVLESLVKQFNGLSEEDKASLRAQICEPKAP